MSTVNRMYITEFEKKLFNMPVGVSIRITEQKNQWVTNLPGVSTKGNSLLQIRIAVTIHTNGRTFNSWGALGLLLKCRFPIIAKYSSDILVRGSALEKITVGIWPFRKEIQQRHFYGVFPIFGYTRIGNFLGVPEQTIPTDKTFESIEFDIVFERHVSE